jgi:hypothetical protein
MKTLRPDHDSIILGLQRFARGETTRFGEPMEPSLFGWEFDPDIIAKKLLAGEELPLEVKEWIAPRTVQSAMFGDIVYM